MSSAVVRIGTRTSALARWQTTHVADRLRTQWPALTCDIIPYRTTGDERIDVPLPVIGGKGVFTAELEHGLREGAIDCAVHSLKDLPTEDAPGLIVGAILSRADARDVLVTRDPSLGLDLPPGAIVGTSSTRRTAQLRAWRPDLTIHSIRGNVETRIRKVVDGEYDAAVLAAAGLDRLGLTAHVAAYLPHSAMLPAPGQGALAVQCRADDQPMRAYLAAIDDPIARGTTTAERTFLHAMGGGCSAPIAAYAKVVDGQHTRYQMHALVASPDGAHVVRVDGTDTDPVRLGQTLAALARARGAEALLSSVSPELSHATNGSAH